jgi:predicted ATPase
MVTLIGEPSIGKFRITKALREMIDPEKCFVLRYVCAERIQNTTLFPVIGQFAILGCVCYAGL